MEPLNIENVTVPPIRIISHTEVQILSRTKFGTGTLIYQGTINVSAIPRPGETLNLLAKPPFVVVKIIHTEEHPDPLGPKRKVIPALVVRPMLPGIRGLLCRLNTWLRR